MIEKKYFGEVDGREVSLYILKNDSLEVTLSDYGATIIRVRLALKNGEIRDLVRGYDDLASYTQKKKLESVREQNTHLSGLSPCNLLSFTVWRCFTEGNLLGGR